jgi:hypothetical protein
MHYNIVHKRAAGGCCYHCQTCVNHEKLLHLIDCFRFDINFRRRGCSVLFRTVIAWRRTCLDLWHVVGFSIQWLEVQELDANETHNVSKHKFFLTVNLNFISHSSWSKANIEALVSDLNENEFNDIFIKNFMAGLVKMGTKSDSALRVGYSLLVILSYCRM